MVSKVYHIMLTEERRRDYITALSVMQHVAELQNNWTEARHWQGLGAELRAARPSVSFAGSSDK